MAVVNDNLSRLLQLKHNLSGVQKLMGEKDEPRRQTAATS
jgi:hypothetical protein